MPTVSKGVSRPMYPLGTTARISSTMQLSIYSLLMPTNFDCPEPVLGAKPLAFTRLSSESRTKGEAMGPKRAPGPSTSIMMAGTVLVMRTSRSSCAKLRAGTDICCRLDAAMGVGEGLEPVSPHARRDSCKFEPISPTPCRRLASEPRYELAAAWQACPSSTAMDASDEQVMNCTRRVLEDAQ
eukprot:scaffold191750_cov31-Tisochrysis_lutea.AAC.5